MSTNIPANPPNTAVPSAPTVSQAEEKELSSELANKVTQVVSLISKDNVFLTSEQLSKLGGIDKANQFTEMIIQFIHPNEATKQTLIKNINDISSFLLLNNKKVLTSIISKIVSHQVKENVWPVTILPVTKAIEVPTNLNIHDIIKKEAEHEANIKNFLNEFSIEMLIPLLWSRVPDTQNWQPLLKQVILEKFGKLDADGQFDLMSLVLNEPTFPVDKAQNFNFGNPLSPQQVFTVLEILHSGPNFFPGLFSEKTQLTEYLMDLLFENPKYLTGLLQNPDYNFRDVTLIDAKNYIWSFAKLKSKDDKAIAEAIKVFSSVIGLDIAQLKWLLPSFINSNLPASVMAIFEVAGKKIDIEDYVMKALDDDNVEIFKLLYEKGPPYEKEAMIQMAVNLHANKCLSYLIAKHGIDDLEKWNAMLIAHTYGLADLALTVFSKPVEAAKILSPLKNDFSKAEDLITFEEEISKMFRFSSFDQVDIIFEGFIKRYTEAQRRILNESYQKTKKEFLKIAPFVSRYVKGSDLEEIRRYYAGNITDIYLNDLKYGKDCREKVEGLLKELSGGGLSSAKNKPFSDLPPSGKGTKRAAGVLEKIGEMRSRKQEERAGRNASFQKLRTYGEQWSTPIGGRYGWAAPIVRAVFANSNAGDLTKDNYANLFRYKGFPITKNVIKPEIGIDNLTASRMYHGLSKIEDTWPDIENVFEELMAFNLVKPAANAPVAEVEKYKARLTEFYSKAAELVWLIGGTQPLERGSGTVAEWMLGIVHLANGLEPPVLKTEFPQLDVLDLIFPLSDYKKFFPYFFEQSTIPEHLRRPASAKSVFEQIEDLYAA